MKQFKFLIACSLCSFSELSNRINERERINQESVIKFEGEKGWEIIFQKEKEGSLFLL